MLLRERLKKPFGRRTRAEPQSNRQSQKSADEAVRRTTSMNQAASSNTNDCWAEAFERLRTDEPELFEVYGQQLSTDGQIFDQSVDQMQASVDAKMSDREAKQLVLSLWGRDIKIREYGEKIVKFIMWSKELISSATASQPYAALAMAGVSVLLPLMLQPSEETSTMIEGLHRICFLVHLYELREKLYLNIPGQHSTHIREAITKLYSDILVYQATMLCHLSHSTISRGLSSVSSPKRWQELIDGIDESATKCASFEHYVDVSEARRLQCEQIVQSQRSHQALLSMKDSIDDMHSKQLERHDESIKSEVFAAFYSKYREGKNRNPERMPGTCEWFLQSIDFGQWRDSPNSRLLWLSADPGCGKSVLSRCMIDEKRLTKDALATSVCYFFFRADDQGRKYACNALTAVIHQLIVQNPVLLSHAAHQFRLNGKGLTAEFCSLWEVFLSMVKDPRAGKVICLLDSLDECEEKSRNEFLHELAKFYTVSSNVPATVVKFLITSRPYEIIKAKFQDFETSVNYVHFDGDLQSDQISHEIDLFIDDQTPRVAKTLSPQDQQEVAGHLKAMRNRTYLWVHLILDVIDARARTHPSASRIRAGILHNLPTSLYTIYEDILSRILSEDRDRAKVLFQIMLAAKAPLSPMELITAAEIILRENPKSYPDLDLPSEKQCISMIRELGGLILSEREGRISFLHETVREFLLSKSGSSEPSTGVSEDRWQHSISPRDSDMAMARACMVLLNFSEFDHLPPWFNPEDSDIWKGPETGAKPYSVEISRDTDMRRAFCSSRHLSEYACRNWAAHFRAIDCRKISASPEAPGELLDLAATTCQTNSNAFAFWYSMYLDLYKRFYRESPLTVACALGLPSLCHSFMYGSLSTSSSLNKQTSARSNEELEIKRKVNFIGGRSRSPIHAACEANSLEVVEMLVAAGADPNPVFEYVTSTPLTLACKNGNLDIVRVLVAHGARAKDDGDSGSVAFRTAYSRGHEEITQFLVSHFGLSEQDLDLHFM